jgi:hypothetical protein
MNQPSLFEDRHAALVDRFRWRPVRKVVGFRASAVNLRVGPVTPLDAGRLPTCN